MGTRSTTRIIDTAWGKERPLLTIYRQMDGYPSEHGKDIAEFVTGLTVVNGISGDPGRIANGAGCFAAQLVAHLKDGPGSIYITDVEAEDEEFDYAIRVGPEKGIYIDVLNGDSKIFSGDVPAYLRWIKSELKEAGR